MFVHLHVHTEYSLLDGAARIARAVRAAAEMGMPALAMTDHGVMFGAVAFHKACREAGIRPILGCEVYVAPRTRFDRTPRVDDRLFHLVLLAEDEAGYRNLCALVSRGFTEGFYYKPRVDKELLARHARGLIALSGCLAGEVPTHLLAGRREEARAAAGTYREIFGPGGFFLELQDHGLPEQKALNRELVELARDLDLPLVATNDVHYLRREDAGTHDVLLCIQTGKRLHDADRLRFPTDEFYLKSPREMALLFREVPQALANTVEIAERCRVDFAFGRLHFPAYPVPPGWTDQAFLEHLCEEHLPKRYPRPGSEVRQRLDHELRTIREMGFASYFLIVWDLVRFARQRGIAVGPGRGSAAGSIVAYVLGITDIDPLAHGLLFERFLNPARVSMPDIDIDFCFDRRDEVIRYVFERYGQDRVAQIITFGTMAARAAVRDVGRVLNLPYKDVDHLAKLVPFEPGITLERAVGGTPELRELCLARPDLARVVEVATALEGVPRHASTHAAGLVIAPTALTDYLPLYKTSDGYITTQFDKDAIEELGLLKIDLLGLRTLTVIEETKRLVARNRGVEPLLPLDDAATFRLLGEGETGGVFQLESAGMRSLLRDMRPDRFEDLVALVALYRPGPLQSGMVEDFVQRKVGLRPVTFLHPRLEPILRDTYGVILYQEQVMSIASEIAGFSLAEADLLRRAMGKKKPGILMAMRERFLEGARANGIDPATAAQIFELMEHFGGYGFNKSHSAAYALVAYQTAYLKTHYPLEYMAALLTSVREHADKVAAYIRECRRMGINVLPPDINESEHNFTVAGDALRFGLGAVRNVGDAAVRAILEARKAGGPFRSYWDFCRRLDPRVMNRRVLESLVKAGTFDSLGHERAALLAAVERGLEAVGRGGRERATGQLTLWAAAPDPQSEKLPAVPSLSVREKLDLEREVLGLYISGHPLEEHADLFRRLGVAGLETLDGLRGERKVCLGGLVIEVRRATTRKGETMAVVSLEDQDRSVELLFFPAVYQKYRSVLRTGRTLLVRARLTGEGDERKVIAEQAWAADRLALNEVAAALLLKAPPEREGAIRRLAAGHPGPVPVYLYDGGRARARQLPGAAVDLEGPVMALLEELLGRDAVRVMWPKPSCC